MSSCRGAARSKFSTKPDQYAGDRSQLRFLSNLRLDFPNCSSTPPPISTLCKAGSAITRKLLCERGASGTLRLPRLSWRLSLACSIRHTPETAGVIARPHPCLAASDVRIHAPRKFCALVVVKNRRCRNSPGASVIVAWKVNPSGRNLGTLEGIRRRHAVAYPCAEWEGPGPPIHGVPRVLGVRRCRVLRMEQLWKSEPAMMTKYGAPARV